MKLTRRRGVLLGVVAVIAVGCAFILFTGRGRRLARTVFRDLPAYEPYENARIIVFKKKRRLDLYSGDKLMGSYPIALGRSPEGHKKREGDSKTPEGEYYICSRNPESWFYLSMGISYPNVRDARQGLEEGVISKEQFEKIEKAHAGKKVPLWNTPLGGEICIHGHGTSSDWTAGCVALENKDMRELYRRCPIGTPVVIEP